MYNTLISNLDNIHGSDYCADSGFLYFTHEVAGGHVIARAPANVPSLVSEQTKVAFPLNSTKDINGGGLDIRRSLPSRILGLAVGAKQTRFLPLNGVQSLDEVGADSLLGLDWNSSVTQVNDVGLFAVQKFYAVRTYARDSQINPGTMIYHYAKLRVYNEGGLVYLDWSSYRCDIEPVDVSTVLGDLRDLLVTNYETRIYLSMVTNNVPMVGYVQRTTSGPFPQYSFNVVQASTEPMTDPQQIVADGAALFVADGTKVWWIESEVKQLPIVDGLVDAVGLLVDTDGSRTKLYVSEKAGTVRVIDITDYDFNAEPPVAIPAPPAEWTIEGNAGYMAWADEHRKAIFIADQTNNVVKRLDLETGEVTVEFETGGAVPWSIEQTDLGSYFVACETEIGSYKRAIGAIDDTHALGIGLIPFQYIIEGKADTSSAPGYYFSSTPGLPFGGTLSLQVNHDLCWEHDIRYFTVTLENLDNGSVRQISASFVDLLWGEQNGIPLWQSTTVNGPNYPIRNPDDLWYNHHLGAKITTTIADNGNNRLVFKFYSATNDLIDEYEHEILLDNTYYRTRVEFPRIGVNGQPPAPGVYGPLECGCLTYETKEDLVELDFAAWHPQGAGKYYLSVSGGLPNNNLYEEGPVTTDEVKRSKNRTGANNLIRVGHLLGACDIANVTVYVSTISRVIDGFQFVQLASHSSRSFTLLKKPLSHTPWVGEP